jgi:hypothetical protein
VQGERNLIVWETDTGREVALFEWKKGSKEGTKSIKFSEDEKFCARMSSKTQIEVYSTTNFSEPLVRINANHETLGKKGPGKGQKYWFDGFEFIPSHTTPAGQTHQYLFAWQNYEGLAESQDNGGQVYVFDLLSNPEKPKFSVQCSKAQEI